MWKEAALQEIDREIQVIDTCDAKAEQTRNPLSPSLRNRQMEKKDGKKKKELALLYQPGLREEPAHSQSGPASCLGQGEWMSARKVAKKQSPCFAVTVRSLRES